MPRRNDRKRTERRKARNKEKIERILQERRERPTETRDPRTRWMNLRARGGLTLSFVPIGAPIPWNGETPVTARNIAGRAPSMKMVVSDRPLGPEDLARISLEARLASGEDSSDGEA